MRDALCGPGEPSLSVVIVTHGAWPHTEQALAALDANTGGRFELIIVDNNSRDETQSRLRRLRTARVIINDENLGFGPAANQGAAAASGEHLLLLNSDVFVHPGWLDPLFETLHEDAVGAVVPRLLHPDGSLQDAGALLARDGTVHAYGDGDDPDRLCYRFRRIVDYGTAACILVHLETFGALGGFDARYAPAYYEDTDLCMRLGQRGLSVMYEPRSTVTHVRYGSGRPEAAVELSEHNRRLFAEQWGPSLTGRPASFLAASPQTLIGARDAPAAPRVLVCAPAAEERAKALIRALPEGFARARVTWATGPNGADPEPWLRRGVELVDEADPSWLDERLFHYDLVVIGRDAEARLVSTLARTQPQSAQIALAELELHPDQPSQALLAQLRRTFIDAGVAPPLATAAV